MPLRRPTLTPIVPARDPAPDLSIPERGSTGPVPIGELLHPLQRIVSHPDLADGFGALALCRGVFRNDIAVLSGDRLTSGEFISSVVAIDFRNGCREVIVSIGGTYSVEAVNKFARLWLRLRLLSFFNKRIKL